MFKGLEQLLKTYPEITIYRGEASILGLNKLSIGSENIIEIEKQIQDFYMIQDY